MSLTGGLLGGRGPGRMTRSLLGRRSMWEHLHLAPSKVTDCLLSPSGAPFLHLAQNQEDRHRCLCEGDPGRGLVGGGALDPLWPHGAAQPSAVAVLAHTHKLLPTWPWAPGRNPGGCSRLTGCRSQVPKNQTIGALRCLCPCCSKDSETLDLEGPDAPHREGSGALYRPLPWPGPGCHPSCIFFYLSTEWTLHTWPRLATPLSRHR